MAQLIKTPCIPGGRVTRALLAEDCPPGIIESLRLMGTDVILCPPHPGLPSPLAGHADMQLVHVGEGVLVYAPGTDETVLEQLTSLGYDLIEGKTRLKPEYPFDIAYNCALVGKKAFLNIPHSDEILVGFLQKSGYRLIQVRQGYAKCSTCVISEEAIVTADANIHKKASEAGVDSLLIPPQKSIRLPGYDYGFIGGAAGFVSDHELAFLGRFETLDNAELIAGFLSKHGIRAISLGDEEVVDLGGLIPLCSV